jgi:hypothetical protein
MLLIFANNLNNEDDVTFPVEYQYSNDIAWLKYMGQSSGSIFVLTVNKINQNTFRFGQRRDDGNLSSFNLIIYKAGTDGDRIIVAKADSPSIQFPIILDGNTWPNVVFPVGVPS